MKESVKCGASQLVDEVPQADGDAHGDKVDAHGVEEWRVDLQLPFSKLTLSRRSGSATGFAFEVCKG